MIKQNSYLRFIRSKLVYKLCITFLLVIVILAGCIFYAVDSTVTSTLYREHEQRGKSLASNLALNVVDFLLIDNISQIHLLLKHTKENEQEIEYIFLVDSKGDVLAHTFSRGFPDDLVKLNHGHHERSPTIRLFETDLGILQDISVPILNGSLGHIHLGYTRNIIDQKITSVQKRIFLACTLAAIGAVLLAILLATRITHPVSILTQAAAAFGKGDYTKPVEVDSLDEVGSLARSFVQMRDYIGETITSLEHEVEERRRVEEKYFKQYAEFRSIFDSITDAIVFVDSERRIQMINPAFESIFGYSLEEVKGKKSQFFYADPDEFHQQGNKRFYAGAKGTSPLYEIQYRRKDGSVFPSETLGVPVNNLDGETIGFLGVIRDISQQKQAEMEKRQLEAQLRQSFKMEAIGTMAGGIAHDFNNILAIIIGNADIARYKLPDDHEVRSNIDKVLYASNRAKELTGQILSFSRKEKGDNQPYYLCRLVEESMKSIRSTLPSTIEIRINIPTKCHENITECKMVLVDPTQIHQLLINLCVNSVQAMDETGILEVSVDEVTFADDIPANRAGMLPGTYEYLSISDTGQGIDPDIIEHVFDPFFTTKEVGKGTGMGLSVVHGIVKGHDARIFVDSKVGKGTTFHIYFPVTEEKSEIMQEEDVSLPTGSERILFVDDEEMLVSMAKDLGDMLGYSVTAMTDSVEALELFRNEPGKFDLVITDQTMPKLTGLELSRQILELRPDLPIILCTGFSSKVDEEKARKAGIREFASKPLESKDFAALIRRVLDETES